MFPPILFINGRKKKGKEIYLKPSGYTGNEPSKSKEPGSNGLQLDIDGNLVLCQHGDRRMARMDAPLDKPEAKFITLADQYKGKRFSSPNDAVYNMTVNCSLLILLMDCRCKTMRTLKRNPFNGVYKVTKDGEVTVVSHSLSRPNGLAFFPGVKGLLVANCDPGKPNWYFFDTEPADTLSQGMFFSLEGYDKKLKGLPDGLKIDKKGNVFATGPGGLYIFNKEGKLLGKLKLDNATSNCALSPDEKTLYITNDMYVLRFKMRD